MAKLKWMKKITVFCTSVLAAGMLLTGCGRTSGSEPGGASAAESKMEKQAEGSADSSREKEAEGIPDSSKESSSNTEQPDNTDGEPQALVRIGSLKGPTSMGLLFLKQSWEQEKTENEYEFKMTTSADELLPLMVKGDLDIALAPANVAAVLYQKTEGGVTVIDINTLGVLYMVSGNELNGVEDLKGKTIYLTGKGTTPDAVLHYILKENGISEKDVVLEYKSEAAEVAALLAEKPDALGLLPQPFVTAACMQNEALKVVLDLNEEWNKLQGEGGSSLVTGVTVVRDGYLEENREAVELFLKEHSQSSADINDFPEEGGRLAVDAGIVAKAPIAQKAIPQCNITYIDGEDMKQALSGYLEVLFEQNPDSVGGKLPEDDFYYVP